MRKFVKIAPVVAILAMVLLAGCTGYNKLLKSKDRDAMFSAALDYYAKGKYNKTLQLLGEVGPYMTNTIREDTVIYYTGLSHYKIGDFLSSEPYFEDFRRRFGRSPFLEDVEYMLAKGYYFSSPDPQKDQSMTRQAIISIDEYLGRYPNSTKREQLEGNVAELRGKLYDQSYLNAKTYYKIERYKSAITALRNALYEYPETPHREEIMYLMVKSAHIYADNSIPTLKHDRYLSTMDYYYNFIAEFGESKYRKELDKIQEKVKAEVVKYGGIEETLVTEGSEKS